MDESLVTPELEARVGIPSEPVAVEVTPVLVRRLWEMLNRTPEEQGDRVPPAPLVAVPGTDPRSAREGDPLASRLLTPSLEQVIRYCGVTWNFTPIFFDPEAARAGGLPGTIIPGPLKLSLLADAVLAWAGPGALLESIRAAHRRPDVPGVPLLIGGSVARVERSDSSRRLHCEIWIQNGRGERSTVGAAVVRVPAAGA
jgi:acyl dehydratase